MTVEASPGFIQADTYAAEIARRTVGAIYLRATLGSAPGGIAGPADCQITTVGSLLKVQVSTGEVLVPGSSSVSQGVYYTRVSALETLTCATASSNGRIDRIVMEVIDAAYVGGTENKAQLTVVKGTANPSCTSVSQFATYAPAAPTSSYTLGYVFIPGGSTGPIPSTNILNASGIVPTLSSPHVVFVGSNYTAQGSGEFIEASGSSTKIQLPPANVGTTCTVFCNNSSGFVSVIPQGTASIYGNGALISSEVKVAYLCTLSFIADGTNWIIYGGNILEEYGTINASYGTEYGPFSYSRPTWVGVTIEVKATGTVAVFLGAMVGGVEKATQEISGTPGVGATQVSLSLVIPPGAKFRVVNAGGGETSPLPLAKTLVI
jgi:hypothetical protein